MYYVILVRFREYFRQITLRFLLICVAAIFAEKKRKKEVLPFAYVVVCVI